MDLVTYPDGMPISIVVKRVYGDRYRVTLKCLAEQCPRHCDYSLMMQGARLYVSAAELADVCFSRCKEWDVLEEEMRARNGLINLISLADNNKES